MSLVRRALRSSLPPNGWAADNLNVGSNSLMGLSSAAGVQVTERKALGLSPVYACVRIIADAVAATPLNAVRSRSVGGRTVLRQVPNALVDDPFADTDELSGLFQMVASMALHGNAFALVVERDALLYPTKLQTIHPDRIKPWTLKDGTAVWRVAGQTGAPTFLPLFDVLHVPLFTLPGSVMGAAPIDLAAQGLGLTLAAEEYGSRFFGQGSVASVIIKTPVNLDETQLRIMAQSWQAAHGGFRRSHLPAIASGGSDVVPITVPNDAAQFLETRKFQRGEVAMMFGVPPHMIGDVDKTTSWGSGIQEQSIGFVRYTLRGYLSRIESAFTRLLPPGVSAKFDLTDLLRGDLQERFAAYQIARNMGVLSPNDIRVAEGLEPVDDPRLDEYVLPMNSSISAVDAGIAPAAAPAVDSAPQAQDPEGVPA